MAHDNDLKTLNSYLYFGRSVVMLDVAPWPCHKNGDERPSERRDAQRYCRELCVLYENAPFYKWRCNMPPYGATTLFCGAKL